MMARVTHCYQLGRAKMGLQKISSYYWYLQLTAWPDMSKASKPSAQYPPDRGNKSFIWEHNKPPTRQNLFMAFNRIPRWLHRLYMYFSHSIYWLTTQKKYSIYEVANPAACMVTHIIARLWINPVRLPILHMVSWTEKMNISLSARVVRAWEYGLARRVRQSCPAPACSSPYSGWIWCLLTGLLPSSAAASIYLFKTAVSHRVSPEFIGSRSCVPIDGVHCRESPSAQGQ